MIRLTCPCGASFEREDTESHLHDSQGRELCLPCAKVEAKKPRTRRKHMAKAKQKHEAKQPRKRARQGELPGMEKPRFPRIETAAEHYRELREEQKALAERVTAARDQLIFEMRQAKQSTYRDDTADPPFVITVEAKDNVKLTEVRPEPKTDLERRLGSPENVAVYEAEKAELDRMAKAAGAATDGLPG